MDLESTRKLRLDRRLMRRRGWIKSKDLDAALSELPDVSTKIAPPEEPGESATSSDAPEAREGGTPA